MPRRAGRRLRGITGRADAVVRGLARLATFTVDQLHQLADAGVGAFLRAYGPGRG